MCAGHLLLGLWPALHRVDRDFGNLFVAGRAAADGADLGRLYDEGWLRAQGARWPELGLVTFVPHPPANVLLLAPLAGLGPAAAKAVVTLLLAVSLVASVAFVRRLTGLGWAVSAVLVLLPAASVANALAYGQPYPLFLLLFAGSLLALERGLGFTAGLLLAPVAVLKLYALPHVAWLLWTRRFRAAAGFAFGAAGLVLAAVAGLGLEAHRVFVVEVLPRALRGEVQDPSSPIWGSVSSLAYRLFRFEADLNPSPVAHVPWLAEALARGLVAALLAVAVLAGHSGSGGERLRREFACVSIAMLAASPLTASYHLVMLALPVALLWDDARAPRSWLLLGVLAFVGSPLPHYGMRFVGGWGSLLAYTRLYALVALFVWAVAPLVSRRRLVAAGAVGGLVAVTAALGPRSAPDAGWRRIEAARGYSTASPLDCGADRGWTAIRGDRMVVETSAGRMLAGAGPAVSIRCDGESVGVGPPEVRADEDGHETARVAVHRSEQSLVASGPGAQSRVLAQGRFRRPRLSPDGRQVAVEWWSGRSWDVRVIDLDNGASEVVAAGPGNETEPSWTRTGDGVLFASDAGRGLGSTAVYCVPIAEDAACP